MLIIAFIKGWRTFFYGCKDFIIVYIAKQVAVVARLTPTLSNKVKVSISPFSVGIINGGFLSFSIYTWPFSESSEMILLFWSAWASFMCFTHRDLSGCKQHLYWDFSMFPQLELRQVAYYLVERSPPVFTAKWVLHSTSAGTRFFVKYSVMFKGIHCVYLLCHAFKLVFHNWQGNIRPLCFPHCKAAPSKAYRHSKPWLCTCFQLSRARRCSAPTTRNTSPKITQPQMGSCSEMK